MPSPPCTTIQFAMAAQPFDNLESARLRRYHRKATELQASTFLREPQEFRPDTDANGHVVYEITNASPGIVGAIMPPLRLFYAQQDNISFARMRTMIGRHAHARASEEGTRLLELLRWFADRHAEIMSFDPDMGIYQVENGNVTTLHEPTAREIFEDWLYGEYLHDDEDRIARIDRWRAIGVHEWLFLVTLRELASLYVDLADRVVRPILDEPTLHLQQTAST